MDLNEALKEIDKLKKENEILKNAVLNNSKVIIQQDTSVELFAAYEIIKVLQQEIQKLNSIMHENSLKRYEWYKRYEENERRYKKERGLE